MNTLVLIMGSTKSIQSKAIGDGELNSLNSQKQTDSYASIQNSGTDSNNSLGDEYYVIKGDMSIFSKSGDFLNKGSSSNKASKEQSKIRPHSLFNESNTDFKFIDTTLPDIEDGDNYTQVMQNKSI